MRFGALRLSRNPIGWAHVAEAATQSRYDGGEGSESGHFSDPFRFLTPPSPVAFLACSMSSVTRRLFVFDEPDRFLAGAVGEPGSRAFFLQAHQGKAIVTVGLEKTQVGALAQRIGELLVAAGEAPQAFTSPAANGELAEPMVELFRVGVLALGWDPASASITVEARNRNEPSRPKKYVGRNKHSAPTMPRAIEKIVIWFGVTSVGASRREIARDIARST